MCVVRLFGRSGSSQCPIKIILGRGYDEFNYMEMSRYESPITEVLELDVECVLCATSGADTESLEETLGNW